MGVWWGQRPPGPLSRQGILAESLRRKKEREQRLQDYRNRPKDGGEGEGKGNRLTGKQIAKAYIAAKNNFKAKLQQAQALGMSAERAAQLQADVAKSGKIGGALNAAKGYIARLEENIKSHYRKSSDDQPPPDAVTIPPLTAEQYAAVANWNTAAQVGVYGITTGLSTMIGVAVGITIPGGEMAGAIIGAMAGVMWGAYEANCIASVQDEFDEAYEQGSGVTIWRDGWKFNVDANHDGFCTQANGPLSALYVAATTLILTGKIP